MASTSGTMAAVGEKVTLTGNGELTHLVSLSGTFSGFGLIFETSPDGTNWYASSAVRASDGVTVSTVTISAAAAFYVPANGMQSRVRTTARTSGTASVRIDGVQLPMAAVVPPPGVVSGALANVAPQTSLAAATANGNGATLDFGTCCRSFGMQVVLAGDVIATGGTITLRVSNDGTNWSPAVATFTIGTQANFEMVFAVDKPARYARAVLASLAGGTNPTVTATVAGAA